MKNVALIIIVILLGGAAYIASDTLFIVDEAEQAIIVQLGAPVGETISTPGLHFKLPFVQEVRRFDKRLLIWDGDPNQIPTRGEQFITVDTTARWRIVDPLKFLKSVQNERGATHRLNDILDSVVRDHISATDLVEIVRSKDWKISADDLERVQVVDESDEQILLKEVKNGREELVASILRKAQLQMPEYGIELVDIRLKRVDYVESVQQRVFDRMIAERQRIAEQFRSEGQGLAAEIDGETARELREIRSEAERKAEVIRGQADAQATRIYSEAFNKDPEFYAFFRSMDSYRSSIGKDVTLILDSDSEYFRYIKNIQPKSANERP